MADKEDLARDVRKTARHFAEAVTEAQKAGLIVNIQFYREEENPGQLGHELRISVDIEERLRL